MTIIEAEKIFEEWKQFQEINTKLVSVFSGIPESFLPYSIQTIVEATDIISNDYINKGENEYVKTIKETQLYLLSYLKDEDALDLIIRDSEMMSKSAEFKEVTLKNLKLNRDSWANIKSK